MGREDLSLVDTSRVTQADDFRGLAERPERTLPTVVLTPEGEGPFPLIVFAHGHSRLGTEYVELATTWAEQGYVVALPTFPLSSGPEATPDDLVSYTDVLNQPGDLSFVIDELLARDDTRIDPESVGVVGHSLGALTTLGLRNYDCCTDPRVDAVVAVAGMQLPFAGEQITAGAAPLLLVHSAADPTVPVAGSDAVFADAPPPMAFLRFEDGGHDEIFDADSPPAGLTQKAILAFLDAHLRDNPTAWSDFPTEAKSAGLATFEELAP